MRKFWHRCREVFSHFSCLKDTDGTRTLVVAAMDTTSNALARLFELLANNINVQEKFRKEIIEARNGQDVPYDRLVDLPYLDAVCRETLRL